MEEIMKIADSDSTKSYILSCQEQSKILETPKNRKRIIDIFNKKLNKFLLKNNISKENFEK
jgi:hypothetical protein